MNTMNTHKTRTVFIRVHSCSFVAKCVLIPHHPAPHDAVLARQHDADRLANKCDAPPGRMRADSVSTVSSSSTGTAACRMIGPASRSSSTKCTVQPLILYAMLQRLVLRVQPGKRRQQRRMNVQNARPETARMKLALSSRMKPARHTKSTPWRRARRAPCGRRLRDPGPWRAAHGVQPALAGDLQPARFGPVARSPRRFRRRCCRRPRCRAMASKFEPRPESRMPSRFIGTPRADGRVCGAITWPMRKGDSPSLPSTSSARAAERAGNREDHAHARD